MIVIYKTLHLLQKNFPAIRKIMFSLLKNKKQKQNEKKEEKTVWMVLQIENTILNSTFSSCIKKNLIIFILLVAHFGWSKSVVRTKLEKP